MGSSGATAEEERERLEASEGGEEPILRVEDLKTHFFVEGDVYRAVDGISFEVYPGECLGIVGESGSGKSVTQISVMGLIPSPPGKIVGGKILYRGRDLLEQSDAEVRRLRGNEIAMIWQDPMSSLNPFLRISRQLLEPLQVHQNLGKKEARERAIEMLVRVGIPDARNRFDDYPHQFSGGMRQRVMIAMALLCEPKLLIADEPTTALDVTIQAQILELIRELRDDFNTSVVMITHDLGVVAGMADRLIVMYAGRIMEKAASGDLFYRPAHPYTVGLLRSVPRLDRGRGEKLIPIEGRPPDTSKPIPGCPFADRCDWAVDVCHEEFPQPQTFESGHMSYCWRADEVYRAGLGSHADVDYFERVEQHVRSGGHIDEESLRALRAGPGEPDEHAPEVDEVDEVDEPVESSDDEHRADEEE
jgi:oligopeptide transport system ATP-binding protein